jgi:uncharacterized protein YodC (DUF2158 family)
MTHDEVKMGMAVWLKSGGPQMTVEKEYSGTFRCVWFDAKNEWHEQNFLPELLTTEQPNRYPIIVETLS